MMNIIYWKAIALFMTGHALSWFQLNSHMVFDWWKGKEYLAVLVFGVPAGFMFLFGRSPCYSFGPTPFWNCISGKWTWKPWKHDATEKLSQYGFPAKPLCWEICITITRLPPLPPTSLRFEYLKMSVIVYVGRISHRCSSILRRSNDFHSF